jgi:hypothetical protein
MIHRVTGLELSVDKTSANGSPAYVTFDIKVKTEDGNFDICLFASGENMNMFDDLAYGCPFIELDEEVQP